MLNRIPKQGQDKNPYEIFTGKQVNYVRDFHVEWGEPVVVKKPKGVSSDLNVTGQWGVVARHIINGTGILKGLLGP